MSSVEVENKNQMLFGEQNADAVTKKKNLT